MKKIYYLFSVSPTCGADIEKLDFTKEIEDFENGTAEDIDEYEDVDAYIKYLLDDAIAELEQRWATAIAVNEEELDYILDKINEFKSISKDTSIGELRDYLKASCRSWENDCDNYDDTVELTNHLQQRFSKLSFDDIFSIAKDWTGYIEKEE